jgi:hypothetical protein
MPIRINLLAESQALEEMRRKDPVKRAIWGGILLVALGLAYWSTLQVKTLGSKRDLTKIDAEIKNLTPENNKVEANKKKLADANLKLGALQQLSTNRFLCGTLLNALQKTSVDDVQLKHLKMDQSFIDVPEVPARTNGTVFIPGKPAMITEKLVLILDGWDSGAHTGDQADAYKSAVASNPYFARMVKTNDLKFVGSFTAQYNSSDGSTYLPFSLQCSFPERTR